MLIPSKTTAIITTVPSLSRGMKANSQHLPGTRRRRVKSIKGDEG